MYITVDAEVDVEDVIEKLSDGDLKEYGLVRLQRAAEGKSEVWPGDVERMKLNAVRGDLHAFIESVENIFSTRGVDLRTDRLLDALGRMEVCHG